jgi:cytochrome c-type biogenesis protein CcmH
MSVIVLGITGVLTIGVTFLLVLPLLRSRAVSEPQRRDEIGTLYRQHLAELDEERAAQAITEEQYLQSRQELARRVVEETGSSSPSAVLWWHPSARAMALVMIVAMPVAGLSLYGMVGNPLAIVQLDLRAGEEVKIPDYGHQSSTGLDVLTERLKQRLGTNPNDGPGWALLARSYVELGRHSDAVAAFEKAQKLIPDDAQLLLDYADALAMANGRNLTGRPEQLVKQALAIDPRNVKGLMLAGTIAYERRDYRDALSHWEQAQKAMPRDAEPEVIRELAANVQEARDLLGLPAVSVREQQQRSAEAGARLSPAGKERSISGTVTIASKLAGKASPTDTLFVFARSKEGPPMPVAIVRAVARELPLRFQLDDSTSPMPARKLSEAGEVVVIARLSRSGEAAPKSGDLQGISRPVKPGVQDLQIAIDSELP